MITTVLYSDSDVFSVHLRLFCFLSGNRIYELHRSAADGRVKVRIGSSGSAGSATRASATKSSGSSEGVSGGGGASTVGDDDDDEGGGGGGSSSESAL